MALLDELLGGVMRSALGGGSGTGPSGKGALMQAVLGMLLQGGLGGGQQPGGSGGLSGILAGLTSGTSSGGGIGQELGGSLGGLAQMFEQAGMGDQLKSWVSTGRNMPISPDQLTQALGHDRLGQLAGAAGMSHEEAAGELSQMLPQLVDGLTPGGNLPQGDEVSQGGSRPARVARAGQQRTIDGGRTTERDPALSVRGYPSSVIRVSVAHPLLDSHRRTAVVDQQDGVG